VDLKERTRQGDRQRSSARAFSASRGIGKGSMRHECSRVSLLPNHHLFHTECRCSAVGPKMDFHRPTCPHRRNLGVGRRSRADLPKPHPQNCQGHPQSLGYALRSYETRARRSENNG
jgi:hypothetical protein